MLRRMNSSSKGKLARGTRRFAISLQRFALRTQRGPLRPAWAITYELAARGYALYLTGGRRKASVYASGSLGWGEPQYGLSDIDPKVVLAPEREGKGCDRARVKRRWERLQRHAPLLAGSLFDTPIILEECDLRDLASTSVFSYGLDVDGKDGGGAAVYFGPGSDPDKIAFHQKPGLYGSGSDWRLLNGPDRRPRETSVDPQARRIASWLELQSYWRWFLQECAEPGTLRMVDLCVKLVAEPIRILIWLTHGDRLSGRTEVLEEGKALIPDEEPAIARALELQRDPTRSVAPLIELMPSLLRLSSMVGSRLADELAPVPATPVRLVWGAAEELLLTPSARSWLRRLQEPDVERRLLPLADWRALAHPDPPDEAFIPLSLDPTDPDRLAQAVEVGNMGPYPALVADELLVLMSERFPRTAVRGVQCPVTDPVSFALLAGDTIAAFPEVRGWSARDWGRRAVAEHRAWLRSRGEASEEPGTTLAMLLTAARAALFLESIEAHAPELPLTVAAVVKRLGASTAKARSVTEEAAASYRDFVFEQTPPPAGTLNAFRDLVSSIPVYAAKGVRSG